MWRIDAKKWFNASVLLKHIQQPTLLLEAHSILKQVQTSVQFTEKEWLLGVANIFVQYVKHTPAFQAAFDL